MNRQKYQRTVAMLAKAKLGKTVKSVLNNAEEAWQAQRQAISLIDFKNDEVKGERQLKELENSLGLWIISLEVLEHAAKEVAKRAHQSVHSGGGHGVVEEDGQGVVPDEAGGQGAGQPGIEPSVNGTVPGAGGGRHGGDGAFSNAVGRIVQSVCETFEKNLGKGKKVSAGEH